MACPSTLSIESNLDWFYNENFIVRPDFVNKENLKEKFACELCKYIVLQPHQTPCGHRVCESCIEAKFGEKDIIPCPLPHAESDEEELQAEGCHQEGLSRDQLNPDRSAQRALLNEKCRCKNYIYTCMEKPTWKNLKEHESCCEYTLMQCPNPGCHNEYPSVVIDIHAVECAFALTASDSRSQQQLLEKSYVQCQQCENGVKCDAKFPNQAQLLIHQMTSPCCLDTAGKCYYFESCQFETNDLAELKDHMTKSSTAHLEFLTRKLHKLKQEKTDSDNGSGDADLSIAMSSKLQPLRKLVAEVSTKLAHLKCGLRDARTSEMENTAEKTVNGDCQEMEVLQEQLEYVERQLDELHMDKATQEVRDAGKIMKHHQLLGEMENIVMGLEKCSYDGQIIWKIDEYCRQKMEAVTSKCPAIHSPPFFSAKFGYKMCLRAFLNGVKGTPSYGTCLSLFLVVMRGEYDDILEFPLRARAAALSLIAPDNLSLNQHGIITYDVNDESCQKPRSEMNKGKGATQFASISLVESSDFLVNDKIYIRAEVQFDAQH